MKEEAGLWERRLTFFLTIQWLWETDTCLSGGGDGNS